MLIERFRLNIHDACLAAIQSRLTTARIGYAPDGGGWTFGTDATYLREFVDYWRDTYDWRAQEKKLNQWPQYRAKVDGVDIHFYHIVGDAAHSVPILLTHGWPGSIVEFQDVIPLLAEAGFTLVVPSLPGFGWSGRPVRPIGAREVARLWRVLMEDCLGYKRFFAQGGDYGSIISARLGIDHADIVQAIHLNFFQAPPPGAGSDAELADYWSAVGRFMESEGSYIHQQRTKPQTLGLAMHDNPVGWASWVIEKFRAWGDTAGEIERRFSKDQLITNLMTYLASDNVISSMWMYYAGIREESLAERPVPAPTAIARFPGEIYPFPSRALAERQYNIVRWTEMPSGGHFAAMEEPTLFAKDVIEFFEGL